MKKALLIGNYGIGNLGDEALKNFFLTSSLNVDWTVLSSNPSSGNEVPRLPTGLRSFLRFNYLKTLKVFISAEVAIFGGGTLFTDTESRWAGFIWWIHACWCYVLGIPYILAFQGFGPFKPGFGTSFAKWSVKRAALVIVRDVQSFKRVKEWKSPEGWFGIGGAIARIPEWIPEPRPEIKLNWQAKLTPVTTFKLGKTTPAAAIYDSDVRPVLIKGSLSDLSPFLLQNH
jgi:hypothetical protein